MIEIACPACNKLYRLNDKVAGKKVRCKECEQVFEVPAAPVEPVVMAEVVEAVPVEAVPVSAPAAPVQAAPAQPQSFGAQAAQPDTSGGDVLRGTTSHFSYEISQRPDFSIVKVDLPAGGKIYSEPSAMVSMSPNIHLEAGFKGGLGKTVGRMLGGESLIVNTYTSQEGPGEVMFAGGAAGDITHYALNGNSLMIQRGAYMLNSEGVDVSGKWQGAKGFFSGEGLILLRATGQGDVFFNSYGAIMPIDVSGGFMVDTGYIVAFEDTLQYHVTVLPGLRTGGKIKSFFFGGEGLVCQFSGHGRVWVQTRQVGSFLSWVNPFRPAKNN